MSRAVTRAAEIKIRRDGTRVFVCSLLDDGKTWVVAEVKDPETFFQQGHRMALAAKDERRRWAMRHKGMIR